MSTQDTFEALTLSTPITKGERTLETLNIKPFKVKHLRAMDAKQGQVGKMLALASALTGEPESILDELCAEDYLALTEAITRAMGPLGKSPSTGQEPEA